MFCYHLSNSSLNFVLCTYRVVLKETTKQYLLTSEPFIVALTARLNYMVEYFQPK